MKSARLKALLLGALMFFGIGACGADSGMQDFEREKGKALLVQFAFVGHNFQYDGPLKEPWHVPLLHLNSVSFATQEVSMSPYIMDMSWLNGRLEPKGFYVWVWWDRYMDSEKKSLCYTPFGIGCVFPAEKKFKSDYQVYESPELTSPTIHTLHKNDVVFALAKVGDFYQVIIYPQAKGLEKLSKDKAEYAKGVEFLEAIEPLNGFVKAKALPKAMKEHHIGIRIDPQYSHSRVFATPPLP